MKYLTTTLVKINLSLLLMLMLSSLSAQSITFDLENAVLQNNNSAISQSITVGGNVYTMTITHATSNGNAGLTQVNGSQVFYYNGGAGNTNPWVISFTKNGNPTNFTLHGLTCVAYRNYQISLLDPNDQVITPFASYPIGVVSPVFVVNTNLASNISSFKIKPDNLATLNNFGLDNIQVSFPTSNPIINSVSVPLNNTYAAGDDLNFSIQFDQNIIVNTLNGVPQITIAVGSSLKNATYSSGSDTSSLDFVYTVQAGDFDSNGIGINGLSANGGSLQNSNGLAANLNLNNVANTNGVLVDGVAPTGYTVKFDQALIAISNENNASFTIAAAEIGATYQYTITSNNGGTPLSGSGVISQANQQISDLNLSGLSNGVLNLSLQLTDGVGNTGSLATAQTNKQTLVYQPDANQILYVNKNTPNPQGDGSSWANAIPELAHALKWANNNASPNWATTPLQIWVAGGTYTPLYSPIDGEFGKQKGRANAFLLVKDVQLFGGFAGTENSISQRDLSNTNNASILSGDRDANDALINPAPNRGVRHTASSRAQNTYHVLMGSGNLGQTKVDGFTIQGANASSVSQSISGFYINGNYFSHFSGGGIYIRKANIPFKNLKLQDNTANRGAGIYNIDANSSLVNSIIHHNHATDAGGGIYINLNGQMQFTNVSIALNSAPQGEAIVTKLSNPILHNSIIFGDIKELLGGTYTAYHSLIEGNNTTTNGNINTYGLTPTLVFNNPFQDDFSLKNTSRAVNAGNNTAYTQAGGNLLTDVDLNGQARLYDDSFFSQDQIDLGALEYNADLPVRNTDFTANPTEGCGIPHTVFFTDTSEYPDLWEWDFGDGNTSTAQNPKHNFVSPGDYTVSLKTTDTIFNTYNTHTALIRVQTATANFTSSTTSSCIGSAIAFTDTSTLNGNGSITQWEWDFGDGNTSTVQNPSHTYSTPGNFKVSLKITTDTGCSYTENKIDYISINQVIADFSTTDTTTGFPNLTVNFQDNSTSNLPITGWLWDFGDGNTSTLQNPTHTYSSFGVYDVSLNITTTQACSASLTKNGFINTSDNLAPTALCQSLQVYLDANGTASITPAMVDAGSTDNDQIASIQITPQVFDCSMIGAQSVSMLVTDRAGNTSSCSINIQVIDSLAPVPDLASLPTITKACELLPTDLTPPTATDNCGGSVLVTNDAVFPINTQGNHSITWTFQDQNGNTSTQTQNIVIDDTMPPTPDLASLPTISKACELLPTDLTPPTATDNCGGSVLVTNDAVFPINTQGNHSITWTFQDQNGNTSTQTQNIQVLASSLEAVSFNDGQFTYDGNLHSLSVSNLPAGAQVNYSISPQTSSPNGAIDAGNYTVTAVISPPASDVNCDPISLSAQLVIEKAAQSINFQAPGLKILEDDSDFQLQASASSGLPVQFTYSYAGVSPPATVSPTGWVNLLSSGQIQITAEQPGNNNYHPATSMSQNLQINSRDASAHTIQIEEKQFNTPPKKLDYQIACTSQKESVNIEITTEVNAQVSPAKSFKIETPKPGIYKQKVTITSQDGSSTQTYWIIIEKQFAFFDIVHQKFDNVLLVNNNPATNGGYQFVGYQWFKNAKPIGNEQYYSAGPHSQDILDPQAEYAVKLYLANGAILRTCIGQISLSQSADFNAWPNPNQAGNQLHFEVSQTEISLQQPAFVRLYTLQGIQVGVWKITEKNTPIDLPETLSTGTYLASYQIGNHTESFKLIIE